MFTMAPRGYQPYGPLLARRLGRDPPGGDPGGDQANHGSQKDLLFPEGGVLVFEILRNGEAIGTHTYRFDQSEERTEVRIKPDIDFRLLFIPIYKFEHASREVWQDGRLTSLESNTNENGTPVKLEVHRDENSLMVISEDGNLHVVQRYEHGLDDRAFSW